MLLVSISLVPARAAAEFAPRHSTLISSFNYAGLLLGAIVFGALADTIGRKLVWQASLFGVCIFVMAAAGSPSWGALTAFVTIYGFFAGGNREFSWILSPFDEVDKSLNCSRDRPNPPR